VSVPFIGKFKTNNQDDRETNVSHRFTKPASSNLIISKNFIQRQLASLKKKKPQYNRVGVPSDTFGQEPAKKKELTYKITIFN